METFLKYVAGWPVTAEPTDVVVLAEGSITGKLLVLIEGTVAVQRGGTDIAFVSEAGSIFGELSILLHKGHAATVRTLTDCKFAVIDDGAAFLASHPEAAVHLCTILAARLDMLLGYLADVKAQFSEQENHLAMLDNVMGCLCHHHGQAAELGSERDQP